jgi:hypothetical protein
VTRPGRTSRALRAAVLLAVWVVAAPPAGAEPPAPAISIGAGGRVESSSAPVEAHAWLTLARPDGEGHLLVHLPPRRGSAHGEAAGTARRARELDSPPLAMAAHGRELVMVFDGAPRRVLSIRAVPSALDGLWQDTPAGRMTPLPPLPAGGDVLGLALPGGVPTVLLRAGGPDAGDPLRLLALIDGSWADQPLPDGFGPVPDAGGAGHVVLSRGAALILVRAGSAGAVFTRPTGDAPWSRRPLRAPLGAVSIGAFGSTVVLLDPERSGDDPRGEVLLAGPSETARLARVDLPTSAGGGGPALAVLPDETGRLAVVWMERDGDAIVSRIREISLSTGRVLYDGPVARVAPVSAEEFRLLAAGLLIVMVVSLFVVLRPGGEDRVLVLPAGTALASGGQRFSATVLDVGACAAVVSVVSGVPFLQIVTGAVLVSPGNAWATIPAVFAVGAVYGTIFDRLTAGTPGKLLIGCRVLRGSVAPPGRGLRLGWGAALVRNVIKWTLPPVAALAVLDTSGRHRGDLAAGAVVVTRAPEPDDPAGDDPR